jgi:hypothetical protein
MKQSMQKGSEQDNRDSQNRPETARAQTREQPAFADKRAVTAMQRQLVDSIERSPYMAAQRKRMEATSAAAPARAAASRHTGLPDQLKHGVESLSGIAMDDVKVHYNSAQPAQLQAHAYAQGTDIHIGPGHEQHLPHEAWHVVQQKQGRVAPTVQAKGSMINDDAVLEREADAMGAQASRLGGEQGPDSAAPAAVPLSPSGGVKQRKTLTGLSVGSAVAGANEVYFSGGGHEVAGYWNMPLITRSTRAGLLQAIAKQAGELGHEIDARVGPSGWNFAAEDAEKPGVAFFDPIRVRFTGQYGANDPRENMRLDYHFGNNWSGYVIHVVDSGKGIDMAMHDRDAVDALDDTTEYSSIHDIDPLPTGPLEQDDSADAVTKLAGEGARWQCIGENAGVVRDDTRIYTNENGDNALTEKVRSVQFQVLWKSWQATFDKAYGIRDATVVEKLKQPNIQVNTLNGVVDRAEAPANSTHMRQGIDQAGAAKRPEPEIRPVPAL